jgi:hypothetical protein
MGETPVSIQEPEYFPDAALIRASSRMPRLSTPRLSGSGAAKLLRQVRSNEGSKSARPRTPRRPAAWSLHPIHQEIHEMKRILILLAAGLALTQALRAQILTAAPGFTETPLFTDAPGSDISAIGSDSSGNIYYLDTVKVNSNYVTELIKRTASSNYASSSVLYNFGTSVYGDFVKVNGSTVYFADSTTNNLQSISVNGGATKLIANVPNNYDMAFNGITAFIDAANSNYLDNTVSMLNLSTGTLTPVLQANGASGPIAFDANGTLYYGATSYGDSGGIYAFTSAQVANALSGTPISFSSATPLFTNTSNQYLASLNANSLYQVDSYDTNLLTSYDPATLTFLTAGQIDSADEGDTYDGLALVGGGVAVAVSSQYGEVGATDSEVFLVTPEPGSAALLAFGGAWLIGRRRFRTKRRA